MGPEERVAQFQKSDLSQFVRENYSPDQMVLAAAGAVDHAEILRQCEDIFGDLNPRAQSLVTQAQFQGGEIRRVKDLEQAHFAMSFESPNYKDPEIYTAQITKILKSIRRKFSRRPLVAACRPGSFKRCGKSVGYAIRFLPVRVPIATRAR